MKRVPRWTFLLFCAVSAFAQQSSEYPTPQIREEQKVLVHGAEETWRLEWAGDVKPYCDAKDQGGYPTCPCQGFAYGEAGDLFLVRLRKGQEIDRLRLTSFFTETPGAALQRWPVNTQKDLKLEEADEFAPAVVKRTVVKVMDVKDYDHDGQKTEFFLQTESSPCGKNVGILVGLSTDNPHLHAFTSRAKPTEALYLQRREWEALRLAKNKITEIVDWPCFDHGAESQLTYTLQWSRSVVEGTSREYACSEECTKRNEQCATAKVLKESPL